MASTKPKKKAGRPRKAENEKVVKFNMVVSPKDASDFETISKQRGYDKRRCTLRYLMDLHNGGQIDLALSAEGLAEFDQIGTRHHLNGRAEIVEYLMGLERKLMAESLAGYENHLPPSSGSPNHLENTCHLPQLSEAKPEIHASFKGDTWRRYIQLFQKYDPDWIRTTHGQKIEKLIILAETHPNVANVLNGQERVGKKRTAEVTPQKQLLGLTDIPGTPRKRPRQEHVRTPSPDASESDHRDYQRQITNIISRLQDGGGNTVQPPLPPNTGLVVHDPNQPDQSLLPSKSNRVYRLSIITSASVKQFYTKFFQTYGWATKSHCEKIAILLGLAETHPSFCTTGAQFNVQETIADCRIPCYAQTQDHSGDKSFSLTKSVFDRYHAFFDSHGLEDLNSGKKLEMLLNIAESHPFNSISVFLGGWEKSGKGELPAELKERFSKFFRLHGWEAKSHKNKLGILLELAETNPCLNMATQDSTKKNKPPPKTKKSKKKVQLQGNYSSDDSDGSWDDGTNIDREPDSVEIDTASQDGTESALTDEPDNQITDKNLEPKDASAKLLPLLKPDYFLEFSKDAREKCPKDSIRSYAAMANTRRYIVEGRQLKELIAGCACQEPGCVEWINPKTIKITPNGCTITVNAKCRRLVSPHDFVWVSSAYAKHETNNHAKISVLNTMVASAVYLSGNNLKKMDHFAEVLQLQWNSIRQTDRIQGGLCMPVVHECFEKTQWNMLDRLKEEKGKIVLAGDGQFDSPGSCATLCTYTLMALGVDSGASANELKKCGYVISQAVIDKRHTENKSVNMERVGMHWAMQPIFKAGIKVAELVTDDHVQITSDFKKIAAAAEEEANGGKNDKAMKIFKESLETALQYAQPPVDVEKNSAELLKFYAGIIPSNDIWHKAKNLLKAVSGIAQTASSKEQPTYRKYAKFLKNYLWLCAEGSEGDEEKFVALWTIVECHLRNDHRNCASVDLHSKTKEMIALDKKSGPFSRLMACMNRIKDAAPQLCRFRKTGLLESYNGLTLKYCSKRIALSYDTMIFKRELAALDHNHHVLRPYKKRETGEFMAHQAWKKSTKAYAISFQREDKDYEYIGHLLAAMLYYRCQTDQRFRDGTRVPSAAHPSYIQPTLAPVKQSLKTSCAQWLARKADSKTRLAKIKKIGHKKATASRKDTSDEDDDEEEPELDDDSEDSGSEPDLGSDEDEGRIEDDDEGEENGEVQEEASRPDMSENGEDGNSEADGIPEEVATSTTMDINVAASIPSDIEVSICSTAGGQNKKTVLISGKTRFSFFKN